MGKLINRIPGSRLQQAFSKPCLVNLILKDTHLVFSMYQCSRFWYLLQMPIINAHADISSEARGLNFGLSLYLHPYFV